MEGRKESEVSRRRPLAAGVLTLVLLGAMLALVSTSSGSTAKHAGGGSEAVGDRSAAGRGSARSTRPRRPP